MTLRPSGDYADYYPNVVARVASWRAEMGIIPRASLTRAWVRDLPATRLRREPGDPVPKLLSPIGYRFVHNRYTRRDAFPSLYLSDGVTTASSEVFGADAVRRGALGVPEASRLQLVVHAHLPDVLDLTQTTVRDALGISLDDITQVRDPLVVDILGRSPAYELPQCLGEIAHELGIGAMRYPSSPADAGVNVVVFTDHLVATGGWYETTDPVSGETERWP